MRRFLRRISLNKHEVFQEHVEDDHGRHDVQLRRTTSPNAINGYSSDTTTGVDTNANSWTRRTRSQPLANNTKVITNGTSHDLAPTSKLETIPAEEKSLPPPRQSHELPPIPGSPVALNISEGVGLYLDIVQARPDGVSISPSQQSIPPSPGIQSTTSSFDGRPLSPGEVAHIKEGPHFTRSEVVMDAAVDTLEAPMTGLNKLETNFNTYGPSASTIQAIEHGVRSLADGIPALMRALDQCAKIHPFIAVAVLAFRAAYALEMKRRDNDRKVLALFVEMKYMMTVLTQLNTMKDVRTPSADGSTAASRLTSLCAQTASDIRSCSNTCDTYNRKKLIVKCLAGPVWETRLATFVDLFSKRKEEFMFAMTIRTTLAVDDVGKTVKDVEAVAKEANERMKLLLAAFEKLVSPEQREMQTMINKHGGATEIQKCDKALSQLLKESSHLVEKGEDTLRPSQMGRGSSGPTAGQLGVGPSPPSGSSSTSTNKPLTVDALRVELTENLDYVLAKNLEVFNRKFEIQKRQIIEDLTKVLGREGDRIIAAVTTGPHDRILDPDMHNIWRDMGWKGSVKAKHFVLALRDYFFEKTQLRKHQGGENEKIGMSETQDLWALHYLDLHYLQTIHEAIDDDASGFITIEELNQFTSSRPLDWSLVKWLAYWAIGFNMAMVQQRTAINSMLNEMFSLVPILRRENQVEARDYLSNSWENVVTVTSSLESKWSSEFLEKMFKDYIQGEEDRIRRNLIDVKYKIDEVDTLYLVTGPGRIEKNFFALVKVLLERHLQIFHIARTKVLSSKELDDAWNCFRHVKSAIDYRLSDLKAISSNHAWELSTWLKRFANGIFEYSNDVSLVWSFDRLIDYEYDQSVYDTSNTYDDSNYREILVYEEGRPDFLDTRDYELLPTAKEELRKEDENTIEVKEKVEENAEEKVGGNAEEKVVKNVAAKPEEKAEEKLGRAVEELAVDHPLFGEWRCMLYDNSSSSHPYRSMFTINFKAAKDQPQDGGFTFTATDSLYSGEYWTLTGTCRQTEDGENKLSMTWILKYSEEYDEQYFSGTFDTESNTISGTAGSDPDPEKHGDMVFISQQPAEVLVHRPHPTVLAENRIPSLWKFAKGAITLRVRKEMWSWSYFRDRRDNRKRYLELAIRRNWFDKPLTDDEKEEYYALKRTLYPADSRYLTSLELRTAMKRIHLGRLCDNCRGKLGLDRVICMDCVSSSSPFNSLDMCGDRDCLTSEISRSDLDKPHLPSHRTFKSRKMLLVRDVGFAWTTAKNAITRGDKAITEALASYEVKSAPETTAESSEVQTNENDDPPSKAQEDSEEPGSPIDASRKKAQAEAEPISPVSDADKQGGVANSQTVDSVNTSSDSSTDMLEEPNSLRHAEDNIDKIDARDATPQGKDVVSEPSNQAPGTASQQDDGSPADGNEKVPSAKTEGSSLGSPETDVVASNSNSVDHEADSSKNVEPQVENDAKSEASESSSTSRSTVRPPTTRCYYCDQTLESPCWYCVDCEDTTLICMFCDPPGGFDKGHHTKVHTLLSVRRTYEEEDPEEEENRVLTTISGLESRMEGKLSEMEASLDSLDDRIGALDDRFSMRMDAIDQRIGQTFGTMNERFSRIENLLERLIIGQSGSNK